MIYIRGVMRMVVSTVEDMCEVRVLLRSHRATNNTALKKKHRERENERGKEDTTAVFIIGRGNTSEGDSAPHCRQYDTR